MALLAGLGSAALLAAAYFFELVMGLAPCELCLWQRWPHFAAAGLGGLALLWPVVAVVLLGAASVAVTGAIGVYHTGVERGWWDGPQACSAAVDLTRLSAEEMLARVMAAPVIRCDEVAWQMLGLSMASWNALAAFGLAALWLAALRPAEG